MNKRHLPIYLVFLVAAVISVLGLTGCSDMNTGLTNYSVTDMAGRTVNFDSQPEISSFSSSRL
jgi:hypothetical protein